MSRTDTQMDIGTGAVTDATATVTVLGTGMLGTALTHALLSTGSRVTVWNRTPEKTDALVTEGAARAATPAEAIAASQLVVVAISTYTDVRDLLAPVADQLAGRVVVNLTSGTPDEANELARWFADLNAPYLDAAAMSGTRLVGQSDALFLYSGSPDAFAAAQTTLAGLGKAMYLGSDAGAAAVYDTALLTMNMGVLSGFYHAVALARAAGVDATEFATAATDYLPFVSGLLPDHAQQIREHRYPGDDGTLDVLLPAVKHILDTSRRHGISDEIPMAIASLLEQGVTGGHGRDGVARLVDVIAGR